MPDVVVQSLPIPRTFRGATTFVELKVAPSVPKRLATRLLPAGKGLRQSQKNWLLEWTKFGGRAFVLIGIGDDPDLYVAVPGPHHDEINDASFQELINMAASVAGRGEAFWQEFRNML